MLMFTSALLGTVLLLTLVPAHGQDFQKGLDAFNSGEYSTALHEWRPLAEAGDDVAQYNLGFMYEYGRGVMQEGAEAEKWFRRAAEQGLANAQLNLGVMYYDGTGVAKDYAEAVTWYQFAAEQHYAPAQFNLGWMYREGYGVALDNVQAYKWYSLAALQHQENAAKDRDIIASRMTRSQIEEAERRARVWLEAHPTE